MKLANLAAASALFCAIATESVAAPGNIGTSFSNASPITVGDTFTVVLRLSGYTDPFEIDSWNVRVAYDSSIFSYVPGSANFGAAGGTDPQWLSKPNQTLDPTYSPSSFSDEAASPGMLSLSLTDIGLLEFPDRGSLSADGFLVSFSLQGISVGGPSLIAPMAPPGGNVFFDSASFTPNPGGAPTFSGAFMQVVPVPEPRPAMLLLLGAILAFAWKWKLRR